jgi:thymidine kinase
VLDAARFDGLDCVLVDEAQFLSPSVIEQLRRLTRSHNVPVICYGLRTDFRTRLFEDRGASSSSPTASRR